MKVLVIGGTGHIGRFLTPLLVRSGHEVVVFTRGNTPQGQNEEWRSVKMVKACYTRDESKWKRTVTDLRPEVVIDILGADLGGLYRALPDNCRHLLCCGSVWMFGDPRIVPTPDETQEPCRFAGYARRYAEMQEVKKQAAADGMTFTAIMLPNICGPGKIPLETLGGRDIEVHRALSRGEEVILPEPGNNLVGPCDAEDIARAFTLALECPEQADGEIFNVGSAYALTAKRFVEVYGEIYGRKIPIRWVSWQEYVNRTSPDIGHYYHFMINMCPDISKLINKLGYQPAYTPEQTLYRAVDWMRQQKLL